MKILAIGDFHGKFPEKLKQRVKKENPDLILSAGDYTGIDDWRPLLKIIFKDRSKGKETTVLSLIGDKKYNQLLKKDYSAGLIPLKELNKFKIRVYSVFGNGDWYKTFFNDAGKFYEDEIKKLKNIKDINKSRGVFKKLKIAGFGGYLDPDVYFTDFGKKAINETNSVKRRKRYLQQERKMMKVLKNADIMLSHYNPLNCLDRMKTRGFVLTGKNMGVSSYNRAIKKYKPLLFVCGHMHENQGQCKIGETIVVNPGAAVDGKAAIIEVDDKKKKILSVRFLREK